MVPKYGQLRKIDYYDAMNDCYRIFYSDSSDTWDTTYMYSLTIYSDYNSSTGNTSTYILTFNLHTWVALQIKVSSHTIYIRSYWGGRRFSSWKQLL